jgi:hypothetical protein
MHHGVQPIIAAQGAELSGGCALGQPATAGEESGIAAFPIIRRETNSS